LNNLFIGFSFFCLGHILAWFQLNSQFVWDWWREHPVLTVMFYAVPVGLCFLLGTKFVVSETETLWSSRFMAFAASYMTFPLLTWYFMGESMFTPKTMTCVLLSFAIIAIQLYWK